MTSSHFLDLKNVVLVLANPVAGWIVVSYNVHSRSFLGDSTSHPFSTFPDHLRKLEYFKNVGQPKIVNQIFAYRIKHDNEQSLRSASSRAVLCLMNDVPECTRLMKQIEMRGDKVQLLSADR